MKSFFLKNHIIITVIKCIALIISIANVYSFYSNNVQLFNDNIVSYSSRFLTGKYIILLMAVHIVLESISLANLFAYYAKKYTILNYFLGLLSILIALPLLYNFVDDFKYYSGKVSPFAFLVPLVYAACGMFNFIIAGKELNS